MNLIDKLREQLADYRYVYEGLSVVCTDGGVSAVTLEVTEDNLYTVVTGGSAETLAISLEASNSDTLFKLAYEINKNTHYTAELLIDASADKPANEIEKLLPSDINRTAVMLHTRFYSDGELERIVREAIKTHDPAYSLETLPPEEERLVLILSKVVLYRDLAGDVNKRRKLDQEVDNLLRLARDWENAYYRQRDEQKERVKQFQDYPMDGDVIVSEVGRLSLRTGEAIPINANKPPLVPVLADPIVKGSDVELRWDRIRDFDFETVYLYRSTDPNLNKDTGTLVYSTTDITVTGYVDTPGAGVHFYRVYVRDMNQEYSSSLTAMVRIA